MNFHRLSSTWCEQRGVRPLFTTMFLTVNLTIVMSLALRQRNVKDPRLKLSCPYEVEPARHFSDSSRKYGVYDLTKPCPCFQY